MERNPAAPRSSYLSLLDIKHRWLDACRRTLPGYVASLESVALRQALDRVAAEGPDAVIARHRAAATASRAGLRALGLRPWIEADAAAAAVVTTFAPPEGTTVAKLSARLRSAGALGHRRGPGPLAGQALRINHTGRSADDLSCTRSWRAWRRPLATSGTPARLPDRKATRHGLEYSGAADPGRAGHG